jgi:ADP-ribose pyrophosphatase YjhB (NUDIX family)
MEHIWGGWRTLAESVQAVIVDKQLKKFLLLKRKGYHDDRFLWRLVKGRKNEGESDIDALKREIKEETGMKDFEIREKIFSYSFFLPENERVDVNTYLVVADRKQKLMKEDEEENIIAYKWVGFNTAIKLLHYNEEKLAVERAKQFLGL